MAWFEFDDKVGLVASAHISCNDKLEIIRPVVSEITSSKKIRKMLPTRNFFALSSVVVKKMCYEKVGGFDQSIRFGEDWDLWIRISREYELFYLTDPLVYYRNHVVSLTSSNNQYNFEIWHSLNRKHCTGFRQKLQAESWRNLNKAFYYGAASEPVKEISFLIKSLLQWPWSLGYRYLMLANKLVKYSLKGVSQRC